MFQGFYDLASNMITQNRNLNIISNNMANVATPGFKSDKAIEGTFRDELLYRYDRSGRTPVGAVSRIDTLADKVTDYEQGGLKETNRDMDFALSGDGFFTIQTDEGYVYTRNGSFNLDNEGYLVLQGVGRVMGVNGPIQLTTDDIIADSQGNIFDSRGFQYFGRLLLVDFDDYTQLRKQQGGTFSAQAQPREAFNITVRQKYVEDSNVSMVEEMTSMMSSQRALQSASQVLRMYDQLMGRAVQVASLN